jgi:hypothetical protein
MVDAKSRRDTLDKAIVELAASEPYVDVVERLVWVCPILCVGVV